MANTEHVKVVKKGAGAIAAWRKKNPDTRLDLSIADLSYANLVCANLREADLTAAVLHDTRLSGACLLDAILIGADLQRAYLDHADLSNASLHDANLSLATLRDADLTGARVSNTIFAYTVLADAMGLENVRHSGPSEIGVITLELMKGKIPNVFLQGCGFKPWQILDAKLHDPDLTAAEITELQYQIFDARTSGPLLIGGVFISYARADAGFVDKIRSTLMEKGVSVWLDRHDLVAGPLQKQIDRAVGLNNVVLLVLSEASIESDWVEHEMAVARKIERETKCAVLCPVSLDDAWKEKVNDVYWEHLKKKNILDFSKWKTKAFAAQFEKLLKGLKIYYEKPGAECDR